MRIATSTLYTQQAGAIDNLQAQYQTQALNLSTGKTLDAPSDDPTQIGLDLNIHTAIAVDNQQAVNIQAATGQLTSTDNALANLTSVLQSARELATRGASDGLSADDRKNVADQVDQQLQQVLGVANTQYGGTYVFAGSGQSATAPVTTSGSPVSTIHFSGNEQPQTPMLLSGQNFALSPTLQQAFNYNATDGSPSVFGVLTTLRDTLAKGLVTDQSAQPVNHPGQVIYGSASPVALQTTLGATPSPFAIVPAPDSTGHYTISINNADANGKQHVNVYSFSATTPIDGTAGTSITELINANNTGTNATGLTATFDAQTQRLVLTSAGGGAFSVTNEASPGATGPADTSNFLLALGLSGNATLPQTVSTQLGDIDHVLDVALNARALVGSRINALAQVNTQVTNSVADGTAVTSGIEDTDVAKATTQLTATQVALTASYSVTSRLESKDLFDYL